MASPTYTTQGIVLSKTKLGESDLIITFLDEEGSRRQVVAKGARKPSGRFSSHLELFNTAQMLCVETRGMPIAKESRLLRDRKRLHIEPDRGAAASCGCELLLKVTEPDLEYPTLFAMTSTALDALDGARTEALSALLAAYLFKVMSLAGLRPSLRECILCGETVDLGSLAQAGKPVSFSFVEGGIICEDCASFKRSGFGEPTPLADPAFGSPGRVDGPEISKQSAALLLTVDVLIASTFADIEKMDIAPALSFDLLQLARLWSATHVGARLKAMDIFFALVDG